MRDGEVRIVINLPRSHKEAIEYCAKKEGKSLNAWGWEALMKVAHNQLLESKAQEKVEAIQEELRNPAYYDWLADNRAAREGV